MHTSLNISGTTVMFSDILKNMKAKIGDNISLAVVSNNKNELKEYYLKMKKDGKVIMKM